MDEKQEIRFEISERKKRMSQIEIQNKSNHITEVLLNLEEYKSAKSIFSYVNFNQEVVTTQILMDALENGKRIAIPRVDNKLMEFYYINSLKELQPGYMGILEPISDEVAQDENGLMLMPGVAFDLNKNRIGYGKGYYDIYLSKHKIGKKIALAYELQIVEKIKADAFDIKPDFIITEKRMIY